MRLKGWWGRRVPRLIRHGHFQRGGRIGSFLALLHRKSPAVPSPGVTDLERDEATDECTARQTSWTDLPRDVQWKILDLLSLPDLMKVAWLSSTMHSRFKQELDRLLAHTSFQLDSIDKDKDEDGRYEYVTAVHLDSPDLLTKPMWQSLAQAWDAVCLCLSDPQNRKCAYSVSQKGGVRREECSGSQHASSEIATVWGYATDTSAFLGLSNAATMWRVKLQYANREYLNHYVLYVEFMGVAERSRDGSVKVLPFVIINVGRPKRYSALMYLCLMLVICERLHASLEMMGRRLARPGVEPVMPALGRCEALLVYKPLRYSFSWLGNLLLHRTFFENNFNPRRSSIKEAHDRLRKAGFGWY